MTICFSGNHKIYAKQMKAFIKAEIGKESFEEGDWGDCTEEVSNQSVPVYSSSFAPIPVVAFITLGGIQWSRILLAADPCRSGTIWLQ